MTNVNWQSTRQKNILNNNDISSRAVNNDKTTATTKWAAVRALSLSEANELTHAYKCTPYTVTCSTQLNFFCRNFQFYCLPPVPLAPYGHDTPVKDGRERWKVNYLVCQRNYKIKLTAVFPFIWVHAQNRATLGCVHVCVAAHILMPVSCHFQKHLIYCTCVTCVRTLWSRRYFFSIIVVVVVTET